MYRDSTELLRSIPGFSSTSPLFQKVSKRIFHFSSSWLRFYCRGVAREDDVTSRYLHNEILTTYDLIGFDDHELY